MDRRDKIADIIETHEDNYREHLRHGIDIDSPDELADKIEALLPQWIPVSERLPDECGRYNFQIKGEGILWGVPREYIVDHKEYKDAIWYGPLSQPPKEG